jgi:hypothetical protein
MTSHWRQGAYANFCFALLSGFGGWLLEVYLILWCAAMCGLAIGLIGMTSDILSYFNAKKRIAELDAPAAEGDS